MLKFFNLYNTQYFFTDSSSLPSSIKEGLSKASDKFDIIIDFSIYLITKVQYKKIAFLIVKKDGYLIIEDI